MSRCVRSRPSCWSATPTIHARGCSCWTRSSNRPSSRFARKNLELEKSGVSYFKIAPDFATPFGHVHGEQEEVYVVVSGSARAKIDDEVIELAQWDAIRVAPGAWRSLAGGPDGAEVLAFGAPNTENQDVEMTQDFWS